MGNGYLCKGATVSVPMAIALAAGLSACGLPRTSDQCNAIADPSARSSCLDDVMLGHVAKDAAMGAVGGVVVGGIAGGVIAGPRGAIMGMGAGAAGGAVVGGAYGGYEALMDMEANNNRLQSVLANYRREDEESQRRISELEREMSVLRVNYSEANELVRRADGEVGNLKSMIASKLRTIDVLTQRMATNDSNSNAVAVGLQRTIDLDNSKIRELESYIAEYREAMMRSTGGSVPSS